MTMKRVTQDRGEILHLAGFHHLSPGLDAAGAPAFSAGAGDGVTRCGWETFFTTLRGRGLALSMDDQDPASARFVPAGEARGESEHQGGLAGALEHSRRFWRAWRGAKPADGASA